MIEFFKETSYKRALSEIGTTYLSGVSTSQKTWHSELMGFDQTCLYLLPWSQSGHQVCPKGEHCHERCLNGSGRARVEIVSGRNQIQRARLLKTEAFFKKKDSFMYALCHEITRDRKKAQAKGHEYFVRLNGTSDLSPKAFRVGGKNILEMFPDVQFVDYTKVLSRLELMDEYGNYDITFSYDGHNWSDCERAIKKARVSVVGDCEIPKTFAGYPVVNGDLSDIRHLDPRGCVVWLKYKRVAADYATGKYVAPDDPFIVKAGDERLGY